MEAFLRLFRALPIGEGSSFGYEERKDYLDLFSECAKLGFVFSPRVVAHYGKNESLLKMVKTLFGLSGEQMNNAFHKSWKKIKDSDRESLVVEQLAHYLTTYGQKDPEGYACEKELQWGVENLGERICDLPDFGGIDSVSEGYIYIPKEILEIPEIDIEAIPLIIIKGYSFAEMKEKLLFLLSSGVALGEDTINDVVWVANSLGVDGNDIWTIKNKEVRVILYKALGKIPSDPEEFLRYAIYRTIGKTLIIKNKDCIESIKSSVDESIVNLFRSYEKKFGLEKLSAIFYRFKPIFLAFRTNREMRVLINKLRRLAVTHHKAFSGDLLSSITAKIKREEAIDIEALQESLRTANIFRRVRLAYALKFRTLDSDSVLYKIRNGKSYATDFWFPRSETTKEVLDLVMDSIHKELSKTVNGKRIFIPEGISYALPSTEKQFSGNVPLGSCVHIPKEMTVGVHWYDLEKHSYIDLDLSLMGFEGDKIGWDSHYSSGDKSVLFSGDMTAAPKPLGATEFFHVNRTANQTFLVLLNFYNFSNFEKGVEVPFDIIIAKGVSSRELGKNHMINPNHVVVRADSSIKKKQMLLGLLVAASDGVRFYFSEIGLGASITSRSCDYSDNALKYLGNFYRNSISLNETLERAGAEIIAAREEESIDLSPESLEKDSILRLLRGVSL